MSDDSIDRPADIELAGRSYERHDVHDLGHEQHALNSVLGGVADDQDQSSQARYFVPVDVICQTSRRLQGCLADNLDSSIRGMFE